MKKKILSVAKVNECPICTNEFNLEDRKPLMLCMNQHTMCLSCFNKLPAKIDRCPECREKIDRSKVGLFREKAKSMEMKQITDKYAEDLSLILSKSRDIEYTEKPPLLGGGKK